MTREVLGKIECESCGHEIPVYRGGKKGGLYANCDGETGCGVRYHFTAGSPSAEALEKELEEA